MRYSQVIDYEGAGIKQDRSSKFDCTHLIHSENFVLFKSHRSRPMVIRDFNNRIR